MIGRHIILGSMASGALGWRLYDPKGSYAVLYDVSHWLTDLVSGYEILTRFIGLILVDQFNGLMLGILLGLVLHGAMDGLRRLITLPMRVVRRRREQR